MKTAAKQIDSPWRDKRSAAAHIGVCTRTIENMERKGVLKGYRVGRVVRYHVADLDAAMGRSA